MSLEALGFGQNFFNQISSEARETKFATPTVLPWLTALGPKEVACGGKHTVCLTQGGDVYRWGVDNGTVFVSPSKVELGLPLRALECACGNKHTLLLCEGSFVMSFGAGYFGQLGHNDEASSESPRLIHRLDPQRLGDRVVAVAAGWAHSAALTANGLLFLFGLNRNGQCGTGSRENSVWQPTPAELREVRRGGRGRPTGVVCGRHHSALLTENGAVFTWGASAFGRLGLTDPSKAVAVPTAVTAVAPHRVAQIAAGDFHMLALTTAGDVLSWGYGAEGQCGHGSTLHLRTPRVVEALKGVRVSTVACGAWWSAVVSAAGEMYTWGYGDGGWLGIPPPAEQPPFVEPGPPTSMRHTVTCSFDSRHNILLPMRVRHLADRAVLKVSCGGGHTVVLATAAPKPPKAGATPRAAEAKAKAAAAAAAAPAKAAASPRAPPPAAPSPRAAAKGEPDAAPQRKPSPRRPPAPTAERKAQPAPAPEPEPEPEPMAFSTLRETAEPMAFSTLREIEPAAKPEGRPPPAASEDAYADHDDGGGGDAQQGGDDDYGGDGGVMDTVPEDEWVRRVFSYCRHGRADEVSDAIDQGFEVDSVDKRGNTLLVVAAQQGIKSMCRLALRNGADPDHQNFRGNCALHFAMAYGFPALAEWLIKKGADDSAENHEGCGVYDGLSLADAKGEA